MGEKRTVGIHNISMGKGAPVLGSSIVFSDEDERIGSARKSEDRLAKAVTWNMVNLIPGLPNDVAVLCLARVARIALPKLRCVCTAWKHLSESQEFYRLRLQVGSAEAWLYVLTEIPSGAPFKAFNPQLNKWYELPPVPRYSEDVCWQGFACVAVGPNLLLMGGMCNKLDGDTKMYNSGVVSGDVKIFNACTSQWSTAASMNTPRSWFAAAVLGDFVYVAGGQGKRGENMRNQYGDKPKRGSAEVYDPETGTWSLIPEMWLNSDKVPGPNTIYRGKLLFVHQSKLMIYDEDSNGWHHVGNLSGGEMYSRALSRVGFSCESLNDDLYIIGGRRISRYNRHFMQPLNTTEVCKLLLQGSSQFTPWQHAADMGSSEGTVLASAVLRL